MGHNLYLSPLDAKDILEYVLWRSDLVTVSFVCCIVCKDMSINLTNSLSLKVSLGPNVYYLFIIHWV